jgi:probable rRNA maturation factor
LSQPRPSFDISIEVAVDAPDLEVDDLHILAEQIMGEEKVSAGTALAILITGDDDIRQMNRQFLGIDEPTDVLSFPDEADDFVQGVADQPLLGDIAIALETAQRQAAEHGLSFQSEVRHLLAHGILHLCGYDHVANPAEEAKMRAREEHYLGELGAFHTH